MKKFKFLAFLLVGVIACLGFTACGGDDDDEDGPDNPATESSLVGTWQTSYYDEDDKCNNTETVTFKKNGTWNSTLKCSKYGTEKNSGKYVLNGDPATGALLTLSGIDPDDDYYSETYRIQITEKVLVMKNDDGETSSWNRK